MHSFYFFLLIPPQRLACYPPEGGIREIVESTEELNREKSSNCFSTCYVRIRIKQEAGCKVVCKLNLQIFHRGCKSFPHLNQISFVVLELLSQILFLGNKFHSGSQLIFPSLSENSAEKLKILLKPLLASFLPSK